MDKDLFENLHPGLAPVFEKLLALARARSWSPMVVNVLRTPEEQAANVKHGVSWTLKSKHLPQPCCGKSHAVDIGLLHLMKLKNWAPQHPDWDEFGKLGETLGLVWGGRWKQRDCPHFELSALSEGTL